VEASRWHAHSIHALPSHEPQASPMPSIACVMPGPGGVGAWMARQGVEGCWHLNSWGGIAPCMVCPAMSWPPGTSQRPF
jgi:hypothetical protein